MIEFINCTNIGLSLDIIGVIMLFFFGLPSTISKLNPTLQIRKFTKKEKRKIIISFFMSHIAIVFIVVGFIFQLIDNI